MEKRIALLIDAENTSVKYLDSIFMELKNYGMVTYKRMYGDFTSKTLTEWNHKALTYAVDPIQQPRYSTAKNAADIMLVIDAMDIMYTKNADMFCIVSSDSDFTRLVNRICEEGIEVIGMGKSDASKTLKAACTIFKNLDIIGASEDEAGGNGSRGNNNTHKNNELEASVEKNITPLREIKKSMMEIVRENENQGDRTGLGGLKSSIQRLYKDFDERNYGYSSMSKLVQALRDFELTQERSTVYVSLKHETSNESNIEVYIKDVLSNGPIELGNLGRMIHSTFPGFELKKYGYSQLGTFLRNIEGITVEPVPNGNGKIAKLKD